MQNPGSNAGVFGFGKASSFRDAPLGAGPESILPVVVTDSGFDAARRPGM